MYNEVITSQSKERNIKVNESDHSNILNDSDSELEGGCPNYNLSQQDELIDEDVEEINLRIVDAKHTENNNQFGEGVMDAKNELDDVFDSDSDLVTDDHISINVNLSGNSNKNFDNIAAFKSENQIHETDTQKPDHISDIKQKIEINTTKELGSDKSQNIGKDAESEDKQQREKKETIDNKEIDWQSSIEDDEKGLEKSTMTPVTIYVNFTEFLLCPCDNNDLSHLVALYDDTGVIDLTIEQFFTRIRTNSDLSEIHTFSLDEELVLHVPELRDLIITEDNIYSKDIKIRNVIDTFRNFCTCSSQNPKTLRFIIQSQKRFITMFNQISELIRLGSDCSKFHKKRGLEVEDLPTKEKKKKLI